MIVITIIIYEMKQKIVIYLDLDWFIPLDIVCFPFLSIQRQSPINLVDYFGTDSISIYEHSIYCNSIKLLLQNK